MTWQQIKSKVRADMLARRNPAQFYAGTEIRIARCATAAEWAIYAGQNKQASFAEYKMYRQAYVRELRKRGATVVDVPVKN